MNLNDYINLNFEGNKAAFSRLMDVNRQQVTKWINDQWLVFDGKLYAPRREIPTSQA